MRTIRVGISGLGWLMAVMLTGYAQSVTLPPPERGLEGTGIPSRTRIPRPDAGVTRAGGLPGTFEVTYSGFGAAEQAAFQYAVDAWAQEIFNQVPITIQAVYLPLGGSTLGSTSLTLVTSTHPSAPVSGSLYPVGLVNTWVGCDVLPGSADMTIYLNSSTAWYTGTDANPGPAQYDLVTVVMHEIGHGLGISGSARYDDGTAPNECLGIAGTGCINAPTFIYDEYVQDLLFNPIDSYTNPSGALASAITSGDLYWSSPQAVIANSGIRPELYAPATFVPGTSYAHLDETVFPAGNAHSLMTPFLGTAEAIHDPGDILRGMLQDMGWPLADVATAYFENPAVGYTNIALDFEDGSALATSWEWDFTNDGTPDATTASTNHTYPAPGTYTVRLRINGNPALEHLETVEIFDTPFIPFAYHFETSSEGLADRGNTCDRWELGNSNGKSTFNTFNMAFGAFGGSASWLTNATGDHGANTVYYLETPPIDFVGAVGDYFLRFDFRWAASPDAGMNVQYSLDGGTSWTVLGGLQGIDPEADVDWYTTAGIASLGGEPGWNYGSTYDGVIHQASYRINAIVNNPDVRFRVKFGAGALSGITDGIQLDNFKIDGAVLPGGVQLLGLHRDGHHYLSWYADPAAATCTVMRGSDRTTLTAVHEQPAAAFMNWTDTDPLEGLNVYQIRQTYPDGSSTRSNLVALLAPEVLLFQLYPNPATDQLRFTAPAWSRSGQPLRLRLFTTAGRLVAEYRWTGDEAIDAQVPLDGWAAGVYLYEVQSGSAVSNGKLILLPR
ncbi:MAG: PKD domain-containing protein [Bacteroidia bacterium]|nr:PKD domain-containing protein [Bacteroidia bacterium]